MSNFMKVVYDPPPIPIRQFDWHAYRPDNYEPGMPMGFGVTKYQAINDLLEQEQDLLDWKTCVRNLQ